MSSGAPSGAPSERPSLSSEAPSGAPSERPSMSSEGPSTAPSGSPSMSSEAPSTAPSEHPTVSSQGPSETPSSGPTSGPTSLPSGVPSGSPTVVPFCGGGMTEEVRIVQDTLAFEAPADAILFTNGALGFNPDDDNSYLDLTDGGPVPSAGVSRNFPVPVESGFKANSVVIEFDLFQIDGWTSSTADKFVVVINDSVEVILGEMLSSTVNTPTVSAATGDGITWERVTIREGIDYPRDFGYNIGIADKDYRVTISVPGSFLKADDTLGVTFSTQTSEEPRPSAGVDSLKVTAVYACV